MIVKQKFKVEYQVDKPVCDLCKGDFNLNEGSSKEKPVWEVEEYLYFDGKKMEFHKDCLQKAIMSKYK